MDPEKGKVFQQGAAGAAPAPQAVCSWHGKPLVDFNDQDTAAWILTIESLSKAQAEAARDEFIADEFGGEELAGLTLKSLGRLLRGTAGEGAELAILAARDAYTSILPEADEATQAEKWDPQGKWAPHQGADLQPQGAPVSAPEPEPEPEQAGPPPETHPEAQTEKGKEKEEPSTKAAAGPAPTETNTAVEAQSETEPAAEPEPEPEPKPKEKREKKGEKSGKDKKKAAEPATATKRSAEADPAPEPRPSRFSISFGSPAPSAAKLGKGIQKAAQAAQKVSTARPCTRNTAHQEQQPCAGLTTNVSPRCV